MRRHVNGDAVPSCDPAVLFTTAAKLLEDMEQGQVPEGYDDAAHIHMAAKVCLLREEARQLADEARMGPGGTAPTQSGVDEPGQGEGGIESAPHGAPVTDSPFTLLQGVPQDVVGFLKEVMAVEAPQQRSALLEASFKNEKLPGGAVGARPGAFLDCVRSLQQEMLGPKYGGGAEIDSAVLLRLESVWREAITVLEGLSGDANYFM